MSDVVRPSFEANLFKIAEGFVKPARLHFARAATCVGEAFCPNIQPRAHARLTGLTTEGFAGLRAPLSSLRLSRSCCKQVEPGGTRQGRLPGSSSRKAK